MMQRLISLTSCFAIAGLVAPVSATQATIPVVRPQTATSVVIPATTFDLDAQPLPPSTDLEFELPSSEDLKLQPLYIDKPFLVDQPVRLEIKLSQRKVAVYRGSTLVKSYAIAVGRPGWETPKGTFAVKQKFRNPTWVHPLKKGISIPGGDPENPLGRYWIGFWTDGKNWIGFHGTPNPKSVGTAASHGCIRMYGKDIEELFQKVSLGTEVKVVR